MSAADKRFLLEPPKDFSGWTVDRRVLLLDPTGRRPVVSFHPDGERTYLWVGEDVANGRMLGVIEDAAALREFATELLRALDTPAPRNRTPSKVTP